MIASLIEKMIPLYGEYYFKASEEDKYNPIKSSVCRAVLLALYNTFLLKKECVSLEHINIENKKNYWEISKKFFTETDKRIDASKCMYVLDLVTGKTI